MDSSQSVKSGSDPTSPKDRWNQVWRRLAIAALSRDVETISRMRGEIRWPTREVPIRNYEPEGILRHVVAHLAAQRNAHDEIGLPVNRSSRRRATDSVSRSRHTITRPLATTRGQNRRAAC